MQLIDQYPEVASVECLPTFMVTYIEREAFPDIDPSILSYEDPDCYGIIHNETHLALGTMYGKCGTRAVSFILTILSFSIIIITTCDNLPAFPNIAHPATEITSI